MPQYFLCYRRDDTAGHVGRLYSDLVRRLGEKEVFWDQRSIPLAVDHREATRKAIEESRVVLVIIGRTWRQELPQDETDHVRREIQTALTAKKIVVPVLVQGAPMPKAEELPETIGALHHLNAAELSDRHWDADVDALVRLLPAPLPPPKQGHNPWKIAVIVAPLVIGAATWTAFQSSQKIPPEEPLTVTTGTTAPAPHALVGAFNVVAKSLVTIRVVEEANIDTYTLSIRSGDHVLYPPQEVRERQFAIQNDLAEAILAISTSRPATMTIAVYAGNQPKREFRISVPAGTSTRTWVFVRLDKPQSRPTGDSRPSTEPSLDTAKGQNANAGSSLQSIFQVPVGTTVEVALPAVKTDFAIQALTLSLFRAPANEQARFVQSWTPDELQRGISFPTTSDGDVLVLTVMAKKPTQITLRVGLQRYRRDLPAGLSTTEWTFFPE